MFWKLTIVKILVYKAKASCVNLAFRLKLAKVIIKMMDLFFSCRATKADGKTCN